MKQNPTLVEAWKVTCRLLYEGDSLMAKSMRGQAVENWHTVGVSIANDGLSKYGEAYDSWEKAVSVIYNKEVSVEWQGGARCRLSNGEVYKRLSKKVLASV